MTNVMFLFDKLEFNAEKFYTVFTQESSNNAAIEELKIGQGFHLNEPTVAKISKYNLPSMHQCNDQISQFNARKH